MTENDASRIRAVFGFVQRAIRILEGSVSARCRVTVDVHDDDRVTVLRIEEYDRIEELVLGGNDVVVTSSPLGQQIPRNATAATSTAGTRPGECKSTHDVRIEVIVARDLKLQRKVVVNSSFNAAQCSVNRRGVVLLEMIPATVRLQIVLRGEQARQRNAQLHVETQHGRFFEPRARQSNVAAKVCRIAN